QAACGREQPCPCGPNGEETASTRNAARGGAPLPQEPQRPKCALGGLTVTVPPPSCPGAGAIHSIAPVVRLRQCNTCSPTARLVSSSTPTGHILAPSTDSFFAVRLPAKGWRIAH